MPQRGAGTAVNRLDQLRASIGALLGPESQIDALAICDAIQARAPASVKALANDLDDYASFCRGQRAVGLPGSSPLTVAYLEDCEARGLKPATIARRLASLALVHGLLGDPSPTRGQIVRDVMRSIRRRHGGQQRCTSAIRLEDDAEEAKPTRAVALESLLQACEPTPPGLRDAALLSLAYDTGLRVSELVAVTVADIDRQADGSASLSVLRSGKGQKAEGVHAWVSPETVRRLEGWFEEAGIREGAVFRRVSVRRRKPREGFMASPMRKLAWNYRQGDEHLGARAARPAQIDYTIGGSALTPAAVRLIIKRTARRAADLGLLALSGRALDDKISMLSSHSLRIGRAQDLFAAGEDAGSVAQALRWSSQTTPLRYAERPAPATARQLRTKRD